MLRIRSTTIRLLSHGHQYRSLSSSTPPSQFFSATKHYSRHLANENQQSKILTEHIYGRTRIYSSRTPTAKVHSSTASQTCIAAPLTWEWHRTDNHSPSSTRRHDTSRHFLTAHSLLSGVKQNLHELFLPVGYPNGLHSCYKKVHIWLGVETFLGSLVGE